MPLFHAVASVRRAGSGDPFLPVFEDRLELASADHGEAARALEARGYEVERVASVMERETDPAPFGASRW